MLSRSLARSHSSHTKLYHFFFHSLLGSHIPFFLNTDALNSVFWLNSQPSVPRLILAVVCHSSCLPGFLVPTTFSILLHVLCFLSPHPCNSCSCAPPLPQFAYLATDLWIYTHFYMVQNMGFLLQRFQLEVINWKETRMSNFMLSF